MAIQKAALGLALATVLTGCGANPPGVYDLPALTVVKRLLASDMKDFRAARQCGLLIHFAVAQDADGAVRWTVNSSGTQVATFAARLTALGPDRTKVDIDVPAAPDGGEIYDGTKTYKRPALYQPLRPALRELIDARLEQRPFDVERIPEKVRAKDGVCSVQRAGLEVGGRVLRADGRDGFDGGADPGSRYDPGGVTTPIVPGKPMVSAKVLR